MRRSFFSAAILLLSVCCARYEYIRPSCGPTVVAGNPQITWDYSGPPGQISGLIISLPDGRAPGNADASIQRMRRVADSTGRVRFDGVSAGSDTLVVRSSSYVLTKTPLQLRADIGIAFIVVMKPVGLVHGDCVGVIRQRKPWWKVW